MPVYCNISGKRTTISETYRSRVIYTCEIEWILHIEPHTSPDQLKFLHLCEVREASTIKTNPGLRMILSSV